MTHDIFISYSSAQSDAAQAVCHLLEQHDIKCWMAPRNLTGGAEYGDVIEDAIKYSRAVVVLFSDTAARSRWVSGELNVAFEEQKPIIPFRLDETPLRGQVRVMLNQKHWIDAFPDYKTKFGDLVTAVASILGKEVAVAKPDPMAGSGAWSPAPQEEAGALSYEEGKALYDEHLYADALGLLADSALEGNAKAQHLISRMMYDCSSGSGRGISQFDESHLQIIQQLVDAQLPCGYFAQHCFYYSADADCVVPIDNAKSFACLRKAPTEPYAMLRMGICYGFGVGTCVNLSLQLMWYKKALAAGVAETCSYLGQYFEVNDKDVDGQKKALEYYKHGVELGERRSFLKLMNCYTNDPSLPDDEKIRLCQNLCDQLECMGDYSGYCSMGLLYLVLDDLENGISCLKSAIANDVVSAYGTLAEVCWGIGRCDEAVKWAQNGILKGDMWSADALADFIDDDADNKVRITADIARRLNQPGLVSASRTLQVWSLYKASYEANGSSVTYINMANIFFTHQGVEGVCLDEVTAGLKTLVDGNDLDACKILVNLYGGRTAGFEHEADESLYAKYLQKAAELNDVDSKLELAQNYLSGIRCFQPNVIKALAEYAWVRDHGDNEQAESALDCVLPLMENDSYSEYFSVEELKAWTLLAGKHLRKYYLSMALELLETDAPQDAYALACKAKEAGILEYGDLKLIDYYIRGIGVDADRQQAIRLFEEIKGKLTFGHLRSLDSFWRAMISPDEIIAIEGRPYDSLSQNEIQRVRQYYMPLLWADFFPVTGKMMSMLFERVTKSGTNMHLLATAYANLCSGYNSFIKSSQFGKIGTPASPQAIAKALGCGDAVDADTENIAPEESVLDGVLMAMTTIRSVVCKVFLTQLPHLNQVLSLTLKEAEFIKRWEKIVNNRDLQLFLISVLEVRCDFNIIMQDVYDAIDQDVQLKGTLLTSADKKDVGATDDDDFERLLKQFIDQDEQSTGTQKKSSADKTDVDATDDDDFERLLKQFLDQSDN